MHYLVCALQYASITEMLLTLCSPPLRSSSDNIALRCDQVQELALQVCGLALTNDSVTARVNSFGPLSFCKCLGNFIVTRHHSVRV